MQKIDSMNIEMLRDYCIGKPGATESSPFDEVTLVFKVANKMFALTGLDSDLAVNLKCEPEKAIELRETFTCVLPGRHMSKIHWYTVICDNSIPDSILFEWIDDSYNLVVSKLSKREKALIETL